MKLPLGRVFYMLRHVQTEDNVNKIVSGSASVTQLTEKGKNQAISMRQIIIKIKPPIDQVVTSEMQRAIDTAELACGDLPCSQDSGLNERAYGDAEGMLDAEREKLKTSGKEIIGQESKDDLRIRTIGAIAKNLQHSDTPLFVTHGGNIRRVLEESLGKEIVENRVGYIVNSTLCEFITPKIEGEQWNVSMLVLDKNKEIKRCLLC